MYVVCDLEWVEITKTKFFPTQISAIRVNSNWNPIACFSSLVRPPENVRYKSNHIAFSGTSVNDFVNAKTSEEVFNALYEWLDPDDTMIWWFEDSAKVFRKIVSKMIGDGLRNESIVLADYIKSYSDDNKNSRPNQYALAEVLNISTSHYIKHLSFHDVIIACEVLRKIGYPQDKLNDMPDEEGLLAIPICGFSKFNYYYDPESGIIHSNSCKELLHLDSDLIGYSKLLTAIKKRYKPCSCCKADYKKALIEKNSDTVRRTVHKYLFSPDSNVYHKKTCRMLLNSHTIMGAHTLEGVLKTGRKPCKICNPPSEVEQSIEHQSDREGRQHYSREAIKKCETEEIVKPLPLVATKEEMRAINRQKVAARERSDKLREGLSQDEINTIYALTQPRYAFWAAKGHKHFHLRSCPTMKNLSHLCGFETYQDAIRARFVPCRQCKPSSKHDLKFSIPIYNQLRENESIRDLEVLCKAEGFENFTDGILLHIITPVGKWKVHGDSIPIKLEHINLIHDPDETKYHNQHRLFLSFTDVFKYIKQHDKNLIERQLEMVVQ